jgi:hypothetical protein
MYVMFVVMFFVSPTLSADVGGKKNVIITFGNFEKLFLNDRSSALFG